MTYFKTVGMFSYAESGNGFIEACHVTCNPLLHSHTNKHMCMRSDSSTQSKHQIINTQRKETKKTPKRTNKQNRSIVMCPVTIFNISPFSADTLGLEASLSVYNLKDEQHQTPEKEKNKNNNPPINPTHAEQIEQLPDTRCSWQRERKEQFFL